MKVAKTAGIGCLLFVGLIVGLVILGGSDQPPNAPSLGGMTQPAREQALRECLSYLTEDVAEVEWYEVEDNDVYIGFSTWPADGEAVVKGAAMVGNKAINFGCHAWGVPADQKDWRPGSGSYYAGATARHGQIE